MFGFLGYNFCGDKNALDPTPAPTSIINRMQIQNGIYNHLMITNNVSEGYPAQPTDIWDVSTLFNCNFSNNISGGTIDEVVKNITSVKIKRREKGTFDWITIKEIKINSTDDLFFVFTDNLNLNHIEYEYAFVPVINEVEGNYTVQDVFSEFDGVFVCDADTIYKFMCGVKYGENNTIQEVGVFTPFGRQFPVIVSNGNLKYQTGSISGSVIPESIIDGNKIVPYDIVKKKNELLTFLTNKRVKIIKDWNGNAWLCYISGNIGVTYNNNAGMTLIDVLAPWTEVGDVHSKHDLYNNGMIPTED